MPTVCDFLVDSVTIVALQDALQPCALAAVTVYVPAVNPLMPPPDPEAIVSFWALVQTNSKGDHP